MYIGKKTIKRFELEVAMPRSTINNFSKMAEQSGYTFTKSKRGSRLYGIEEYKLFQRIITLKEKYGNEKKIAEIVREAVAGGDIISEKDSKSENEITRLEEKIDALTKGQELLMKSMHLVLEDNLYLQEAFHALQRFTAQINNFNLESITENQNSLMVTTEKNNILLTKLILALATNRIKDLDPNCSTVEARIPVEEKFKANQKVSVPKPVTTDDLTTDAKREVMSLLMKEHK